MHSKAAPRLVTAAPTSSWSGERANASAMRDSARQALSTILASCDCECGEVSIFSWIHAAFFSHFYAVAGFVLVCHAGGVCGSHFSGRCTQRAESTTVGAAATMAGMIRRLHLRANCAQTHPVRAPCTQCEHPGATAGEREGAPRWPAQHTALPQPKFPVFCAHLVLQQGDEDGCCAGGRVGMLSREAAAHVGGGGHGHPLHARLHMRRARAAWGVKAGYWVLDTI